MHSELSTKDDTRVSERRDLVDTPATHGNIHSWIDRYDSLVISSGKSQRTVITIDWFDMYKIQVNAIVTRSTSSKFTCRFILIVDLFDVNMDEQLFPCLSPKHIPRHRSPTCSNCFKRSFVQGARWEIFKLSDSFPVFEDYLVTTEIDENEKKGTAFAHDVIDSLSMYIV